jgi:hypothetical protein
MSSWSYNIKDRNGYEIHVNDYVMATDSRDGKYKPARVFVIESSDSVAI